MKKFLFYILFLNLIFFKSYLNASEKNKQFKIGLLAPFSGEYSQLGESMLFSLQLALKEIGDKRVIIVPRDSGVNNKSKLNSSIQEIIEEDVNVVIGPVVQEDIKEVYKYKNITFISPSNINPGIQNNVISIGVSLESQLKTIKNFISKQKKTKTVILYPNNEYSKLIETKLNKLNFKPYKILKYNPDPKILTGEIEKLTSYNQRKRNLENRKKILEKKGEDDIKAKRELEILDQRYTLGNVNFDSIIILDFGNSLKSVIASLVFTDVDPQKVLFTTVNQWFDKSIFYENSVKTLYYPSINFKNFQKFNDDYFKTFKKNPNEISILIYDALGLAYYVWRKNNNIKSAKDFLIKGKIKGKIGSFSFDQGKIIQNLNIYKIEGKRFKKL